jgi:heme-binding protein
LRQLRAPDQRQRLRLTTASDLSDFYEKEQLSMNRSTVRRGIAVLGAAAALVATAAPAAADEPAPDCTAADLARVLTGVSAAVSAYLYAHPDVNDFYTSLKGMSRDQQRDAVQTYFDANPQTQADLEGIRAPGKEFRERCDLPANLGS